MSQAYQVKFFVNDLLCTPQKKTDGSAGWDVVTAEASRIERGSTTIIPTGVRYDIQIPTNPACGFPYGSVKMHFQMYLRSSIGRKGIVMIPNSVGILDNDYRGEIGIILKNVSPDTVLFDKYDRIAQIVPVLTPNIKTDVEIYNPDTYEVVRKSTTREDGGFGSTGQ